MRGLVLCVALTLAASAQKKPDWIYLGEVLVDPAVDHDQIILTAPRRQWSAIRLRVEDAPVRLDRVVIQFDDGPDQKVDIGRTIAPNTDVPTIYLPDMRHVVRSVELWPRDVARKDTPHPKVILFGS
jgi:hypothetical protein